MASVERRTGQPDAGLARGPAIARLRPPSPGSTDPFAKERRNFLRRRRGRSQPAAAAAFGGWINDRSGRRIIGWLRRATPSETSTAAHWPAPPPVELGLELDWTSSAILFKENFSPSLPSSPGFSSRRDPHFVPDLAALPSAALAGLLIYLSHLHSAFVFCSASRRPARAAGDTFGLVFVLSSSSYSARICLRSSAAFARSLPLSSGTCEDG